MSGFTEKSPFVLHRVSDLNFDFDKFQTPKGTVGTDSHFLVFCALCFSVLLAAPREKLCFFIPSCSLCCGQRSRFFSSPSIFVFCEKESESVALGLRKESICTVLKDLGRELGTEGHCASSTASDAECDSAARVLRTTLLIVLLVQ